MFRQFIEFTNRYKIIRGMLSYGMLWPCGCLIEQTLIEKRTFRNFDWMKCLKFSLFGGLFMGPTIYVWIRLAGVMWPRTDIKSSLCKAITEQAAYDPFAISTFLFTMNLMDGGKYEQAKKEVSDKFLDAYRVGIIYWPCVQTINFTFVPPRNQVVFTSFFSMCWTTFLTYVKYLQAQPVEFEHPVVDLHFHFTH
ncbi:PREDICTED: mpv17-like protein 2 isoform X2 [Rhagoletis zephyria]|nr:PREDICTED: mpv17-like protein 2 isoform X2 [Rhagoletis zephyria]XP_017471161.1 PREDICTED: mpv17-like protein 2 isoform X2 [Rhagoletis zephyria]XP_017471162.1 PREDICTED: mpv17-like protein 2 isoform X2 [Rhagoletis zephyria]XP_036337056.1 mpv17-like protein 2 isoform X2 [Rhagoletis pomonella]